MSSEATHRTEAAQKRNTPAPYWTFFTTDDWAFWHFVDRSRDDAKTQQPPPPQSEQSSPTLRTAQRVAVHRHPTL
jgi:hypothetical protein